VVSPRLVAPDYRRHCLDLAPAQGGRDGQVIMVWHERADSRVVAASLLEWLDDLASLYEEP